MTGQRPSDELGRFPRGWFVVAFSEDLEPGQVRPARFDRDPAKRVPPGDMWIDALQSGYFQDVAIWEHKRWQDEPILCDGDGPIGDLRRWYAQFYESPAS
jgi:hypothetical protein